jgi:hypothetical protein
MQGFTPKAYITGQNNLYKTLLYFLPYPATSPMVFRTHSVRTKKAFVMALDLGKVGDREKLAVQREPHWQRLRTGCFLGFRRSKRDGKGTWIARVYDEDSGKYRLKALGDFGTLPGKEMFAAAKKEAEALAELVESGGEVRATIQTVADACKEYAKTRPEAAQRFGRYVYGDALAKVKLAKLRHQRSCPATNRARRSTASERIQQSIGICRFCGRHYPKFWHPAHPTLRLLGRRR